MALFRGQETLRFRLLKGGLAMICKNCGKEIADRSKFCPKCGNPVNQPEKIQQESGAPKGQVCAGCGHPLLPGSKFCLKCGLRVGELPDVSGDTEYLSPEEYGDETEVLMPQGERQAGAVISPSPPPVPMPMPPVPQPGRQNPTVKKKSRAGLFAALAAVLFIAACAAGICIYLFAAPMIGGKSSPLFNQKAGIQDEAEETDEKVTDSGKTDEKDAETEETGEEDKRDGVEKGSIEETMEPESTEPIFGIKQQ